jgi:hypothetical protein
MCDLVQCILPYNIIRSKEKELIGNPIGKIYILHVQTNRSRNKSMIENSEMQPMPVFT